MDRIFKAAFYDHNNRLIRINHCSNPNSAVKQCVGHMQENRYGRARKAVVYHAETSVEYVSIKRSVNGNVNIKYEYDPEGFEKPRLSLESLLNHKG